VAKRSKVEAVTYPEVKHNVEKKTKKAPSLTTVKRAGKSHKITSKKRKRVPKSQGLIPSNFRIFRYFLKICVFMVFLCVVGTESYRDSVISLRKKCQNVSKSSLVFLDGSGIRSEPRPLAGLSVAGTPAVTTAEKPEKYEPRIDIMGAISYNGPLACETKTSKQRRAIPNPRKGKKGVKGYTKAMVKNFLRNKLSPKIQDMKAKEVIVCMDKGLAFKEDEAKEQFRAGGTRKVKAVWILPTNTAKYVSPLDNTLWHTLKERVRARKPRTEEGTARIVKEEFKSFTGLEIQNYYRKCKLTRNSNPSDDL
jgi:hypothetical protein